MQSHIAKQRILVALLLLSFVAASRSYGQDESYRAPDLEPAMPAPRDSSPEEQTELKRAILGRFVIKLPQIVQFAAAGHFRFVKSEEFQFIDRIDLGSIAFEDARYGVTQRALNPAAVTEDILLPRIKTALAKVGIEAHGMTFAGFQDEFSGAALPATLPRSFDPRKNSLQVARTATFNRRERGVPIFGSELLIGLMPDGRIGRLRLHWPELEPAILAEAQKLQELVERQRWTIPEELEDPAIEILDISAGVGHSGFATPGFSARPVVRILVRKTGKDTEHPLASTRYKYFDVNGREVQFNKFPQISGTPQEEKARGTAQ
jgi:hypothetical protein